MASVVMTRLVLTGRLFGSTIFFDNQDETALVLAFTSMMECSARRGSHPEQRF
jgi:hypothetical protein